VHQAAPLIIRRQLGRYDTPRPLSQGITNWALQSSSDTCLEPSSGSGVFILSAIHRLKELGNSAPLSQIWACDIDPGACAETLARTQIPPKHILCGDYLDLVDQTGIRNRKFDCVIGNPPFVSLHRMTLPQRQRAQSLLKRVNMEVDRKASLWAYFLASCQCVLNEGGRVGMILPEILLHADYGQSLLKNVGSHFHRSILINLRERCFLSGGAEERVVIFLGENFASHPTKPRLFVREIRAAADLGNLLNSLNRKRLAKFRPNSSSSIFGIPKTLKSILADHAHSKRLSDVASVSIGVVTGANDFFLITEQDRLKHKLPLSSVRRILPRFKECHGLAFTSAQWASLKKNGGKCWIVIPNENETRERIVTFLKQFPENEKTINQTFKKRRYWYRTELGKTPDAFLRYMGAHAPRVALNASESTCTNTIHRIFFDKKLNHSERKAVTLSLHSSFSRLSAELEGRSYGSGVLKLEPTEAGRIRILLPCSKNPKILNKFFRLANSHMKAGRLQEATKIADDWLYSCIPKLSQEFSSYNLSKMIEALASRRQGGRNG